MSSSEQNDTTAPPTLDAMLAEARAALALADGATPGPWRWWTSNSFRRLSSDPSGKDGDVAYATTHPSDGHPDIVIREEDQRFTESARLGWPRDAARVVVLCGEVERLRAALAASHENAARLGAAACDAHWSLTP